MTANEFGSIKKAAIMAHICALKAKLCPLTIVQYKS